MNKATLIALVTVPLLLLLCCSGGAYFTLSGLLPFGEDSWRHYSGGGMFVSDSPSLSADGSQIVFATPFSGHGDVYVADVLTGVATRLTNTDEFESSPYFLPGSRQVVFQRERPPCRHIWLLDLQTGQERQLTRGQVLDDVSSLSPNGKQLLIWRSTNRGNGRGVKPHLVEVNSDTTKQIKGVVQAVFGDGGSSPWATWEGTGEELGQVTLDGQRSPPVGKGWIIDVSDKAGMALFMHLGTAGSGPNRELFCLSVTSGSEQSVGVGHSARVFANGKVLYFVGYEHQAMIWEWNEKPRAITSPPGYKVYSNRSDQGNAAALFVMPPNEPSRQYGIFLFDADTEAFRQIEITYSEGDLGREL